ncbi:MAG: VCBS repeat-containing protein, partial [Actinomycetota bacterium]|nr:VCBS repeat-containing protein [Actinomycetota bacterium]
MSRSARGATGNAAVLVLAFLLGGSLLGGCAAGSKPSAPATGAVLHVPPATGIAAQGPESSSPPIVVPCAGYACTPGPAQQLTGDYTVRLWSSAQPSATDPQAQRSTPVLELLSGGVHLSWWVGQLGYGWSAQLHCLATPAEPNCVVTAAAGAHAGSAEVVLLRAGTLISPPQASVTFDGGAPVAADLDHDGRLDVLGVENDYQPNYASGHNFWASYRLSGDALHQTG